MDALKAGVLLLLSFVAVACVVVLDLVPRGDRAGTRVERAAMERVRDAQHALAQERADRVTDGDVIRELQRVDPMETGLIGVEWSHLVSTPGSLDSKRASCDPRWAAEFCSLYESAGVGAGDVVAIGSSASFPGLLLSARVAAESVGARPLIVASLAASNFGATNPEFDLLAMEEVLVGGGLVHDGIALITPGGGGDRLEGFEEGDRERILGRLEAGVVTGLASRALVPESLDESVDVRSELFFGGGSDGPAVFVNIGGNAANHGIGAAALAMPSGLILPDDAPRGMSGDSVVRRALDRGVPVINLAHVREAASRLQRWPEGGAARESVAVRVASMVAAVMLLGVMWVGRGEREGEQQSAECTADDFESEERRAKSN